MVFRARRAPNRLLRYLPILALTLGALAFGLLAWLESGRAQHTAQVLMKGYAAFIADKFEQTASQRYMEMSGIHTHEPQGLVLPPFEVLRHFATEFETEEALQPPEPSLDFVRYYFAYDSTRVDTLRFSGGPVPEEERATLVEALQAMPRSCFSSRLSPTSQIEEWLQADSGGSGFGWSALVRSNGADRQAFGFRVDQQRLAERMLFPLVSPSDECDCPSQLLPSNLSAIGDIRRIAWLKIANERGEIVRLSGPEPSSGVAARLSRPLPATIPFPGWKLEVAIHQEASRALLPFRREPLWAALAILGLAVGGSSALALRALRRNHELLRLRQDFVSNVSHELKTPLSRIRLFNELLMGGKQKDTRRAAHYRRVIDRECRRLTFLIENVLDFSRLERRVRPRPKAEVDLNRLASEALDSFRGATDPRRCGFSSRSEEVPPVHGDPVALQQAIINLLDNAVKYSPPGNPIQLRLLASPERVRLEVQDFGCGIPEGEQKRIFEEFYRIESGDQQEVSGSGLGLALVRRTVRDHGGEVWVHSRPGQGSTFVIDLPALRPSGESASLTPVNRPPVAGASSGREQPGA